MNRIGGNIINTQMQNLESTLRSVVRLAKMSFEEAFQHIYSLQEILTSSASSPLAKAAAVIWTRPSSLA